MNLIENMMFEQRSLNKKKKVVKEKVDISLFKRTIEAMIKGLGISKYEIQREGDAIRFRYNGKVYFAEPISINKVNIFDDNHNQIGYDVDVKNIKDVWDNDLTESFSVGRFSFENLEEFKEWIKNNSSERTIDRWYITWSPNLIPGNRLPRTDGGYWKIVNPLENICYGIPSEIIPEMKKDPELSKLFLENLEEDTVKKSNGKWTNRGNTGKEHGTFKTKKQADAQRKAMYANGYKGEAYDYKTGHMVERFNCEVAYGYDSDPAEFGETWFWFDDSLKNWFFEDKDYEFEFTSIEYLGDSNPIEDNFMQLNVACFRITVTFVYNDNMPTTEEIESFIKFILEENGQELVSIEYLDDVKSGGTQLTFDNKFESLDWDGDPDELFDEDNPNYDWEMDAARFDDIRSPYYNGDLEDDDFDDSRNMLNDEWDDDSFYEDTEFDENSSGYQIASKLVQHAIDENPYEVFDNYGHFGNKGEEFDEVVSDVESQLDNPESQKAFLDKYNEIKKGE